MLTTLGESLVTVPAFTESMALPAEPVPQTEQIMLTKNVQQLAQKLLDTDMNNTELTWQQDGQQYSARVMRQPAADSTGLEQVIAEVMTHKDGKRMKTRLSLKRLAFSHFTQLVNHWDPNIRLHDDVIDGRFHSNTQIGLAFSGGIEPRFFGKVTTAAASMTIDDFPKRRNKNVFQGGVETRTERVMLPRDMPDVIGGGEESRPARVRVRHAHHLQSRWQLRVAAGEWRWPAGARRAFAEAAVPHRREGREALRARHRAPASSRCTRTPTSRSKTTSPTSRIRATR